MGSTSLGLPNPRAKTNQLHETCLLHPLWSWIALQKPCSQPSTNTAQTNLHQRRNNGHPNCIYFGAHPPWTCVINQGHGGHHGGTIWDLGTVWLCGIGCHSSQWQLWCHSSRCHRELLHKAHHVDHGLLARKDGIVPPQNKTNECPLKRDHFKRLCTSLPTTTSCKGTY